MSHWFEIGNCKLQTAGVLRPRKRARAGKLQIAAATIVLLQFVAPQHAAQHAWAVDQAVLDAQQQRIDVIQRVAPAVVAIFAPGGQGGGSGVLISPDGYAVTNFHVVQGMDGFMKCGLNDGRIYDAVVVGIDPTGDVAVIKLLGREDFPTAPFGDSDQVRLGDGSYAMGNPFLLATDFQPTVTYGMVSGVHRYQYPAGTFLEYTDCLQVDTSINPGNSGGPLFSEQGELIGINGRISIEKRGRVNVGVGYAISSNQVQNFLDHLKSGRIVDHATLGATVSSNDDGTVVVANILEQSEAYRRGLRIGDEIVSFAGRPIRSVNQFKNILGIYPKGWKLPLTYRREGQKHDVYVRLRALHRAAELSPDRPQRPPGEPPPDRRGPDDPERRPPPERLLPPSQVERPAPPAEYADMFIKRPGFANYFFNQLERDRVMGTVHSLGDFSGLKGLWTLTGRTLDGREFQFKFGSESVAVKIGADVAVQALDTEFTDSPPGSGGLLAALHALKMLLLDPEGYFSEFYYVGTEPLDGRGNRVDVLTTFRSQVTSRWYFDRGNGRWSGFDTSVAEDVDECEIRIEALGNFNGRTLPARFMVQHGEQPFGTFVVEEATFE